MADDQLQPAPASLERGRLRKAPENFIDRAGVGTVFAEGKRGRRDFIRGAFAAALAGGLALGVIEGMTKVFYPEASTTVVFVIMVLVLMFRPAGLFGKEK